MTATYTLSDQTFAPLPNSPTTEFFPELSAYLLPHPFHGDTTQSHPQNPQHNSNSLLEPTTLQTRFKPIAKPTTKDPGERLVKMNREGWKILDV